MVTPVLVNNRAPIPVQADRMSRLEDRLAQLQKQISTGERFTEPSQDPAGANRAAMLARLDSRLIAEERSLARASSRLDLAETAIEGSGNVLLRARDLALAAANGTLSADDRAVIGREVAILKVQLLDRANARDDAGRFLFAGAANDQPPYALDGDNVAQWQGFGTAPGAEAAGLAIAAPPRGPALFGDADTGAFAQLDALVAALDAPDADLRAAQFADVLAGLDQNLERLRTGQAEVGAGLARMETEKDRVAAARLDTAQGLAAIRGVDLTAAIAEMQALQLTLSAAQGSFARIFQTSLFDRLG